MTRNDALFGTPARAAATLAAMSCRQPEEFYGCSGCPFWDMDPWGPCPDHPDGLPSRPCRLEDWLAGDAE